MTRDNPEEDLTDRCRSLLLDIGYLADRERIEVQPLTGGVASDIALVLVGDRRVVVKFALPRLKVQAEWFAPVHRNAAEYAWLQFACSVAPQNAVTLFGLSERLNGFAMAYLDGSAYVWKTALLSQSFTGQEAPGVGELLGRIHQASTCCDFDYTPFQNYDDFHALRIEPYLIYTASRHPDIAEPIAQMVEVIRYRSDVLIHGDVSPKNIIIEDGVPVLLDAECATMGDAAFDLAFCINHLVLKAIHMPQVRASCLQQGLDLWRAYLPFVSWEASDLIEHRVSVLLPMLMLARVDGKSPVEYLSSIEAELARRIARTLILSPEQQLPALFESISQQLSETRT